MGTLPNIVHGVGLISPGQACSTSVQDARDNRQGGYLKINYGVYGTGCRINIYKKASRNLEFGHQKMTSSVDIGFFANKVRI